MSFSSMKKNRSANISRLTEAASAATSNGNKYGDDRIWQPKVDDAGNGYAVIRFLPAPEGNDLPWNRYWSHAFKGPTGKWYIENSLTTLEQPDPLGELNSEMWATEDKEKQAVVRNRKRKLNYVSNIMVINDPANPENNGKVFLFKFGKKIFDKCMDSMQPEFEDETPVNPFDFWEGANFKIKIRKLDGYRNYDKSEFDAPAPLLDGDDTKLEAVYNSLYNIGEFTDPKNFKTYDQLKAQLNLVLGVSAGPTASAQPANEMSSTQVQETVSEMASASTADASDEGEDASSYFVKLAEQD